MFEQFVRYILGELRLIAEAPLVFGAAVLFLGAIIWAALRWRYSGMIERGNHVIALYKARLNGATPDQAKAKIDSLEGQVASLKNREWPKLTPAAVADFESVLASQGSHVVSVLPWSSRDVGSFSTNAPVAIIRRITYSAATSSRGQTLNPSGITSLMRFAFRAHPF